MGYAIQGKTVTVIGLGNSGLNAALLLLEKGATVRATDAGTGETVGRNAATLEAKGVRVEIGGHSEACIEGSDLVVISPGVEDTSPAVRWAVGRGIPLIGEMELGYAFCKGTIIAITGTNGKSTVTTLIGAILARGGKDVVVCGNIGNSLCGEIGRIQKDTWVVLEVSSFQLERIRHFRPHIALILNITDDHMDRYRKFSDYYNEKLKIFRNQDENDALILNYDAENLRSLKGRATPRTVWYSRLTKADGAYLDAGVLVTVRNGTAQTICPVDEIPLKGVHNVENFLAAGLAASIAGVQPEAIRAAMRAFKGLPHRFETVAVIDNVAYIDDSKGTTVDSTVRALESCEGPVVLIAGGKDKNSDYSIVVPAIKGRVRHLVLIGEAAAKIRSICGALVPTSEASDMRAAVALARRAARPGDVVLLSPMCSSFDMYRDYKQRGDLFRQAVEALAGTGVRAAVNG